MRLKFKYKNRYALTGYLMLLPAFIMLTIFVTVPLFMAVGNSFRNADTGAFEGFNNYIFIFQTDLFMNAFGRVLIFTVIVTIIMILVSFAFSYFILLVAHKLPGNIVKSFIYIPFMISGIILSIIYLYMVDYRGGFLNSIIMTTGNSPVNFATEGFWPYVTILLPLLWQGFGYYCLVMYAGLLGVPQQQLEAAKIDGAGTFTVIWRIILPAMRNYFVLIVVALVTFNLQMFEIPFMTTGGGPTHRTYTPVLYLFMAFGNPNQQQGTVLAGAILVMALIVTVNVIVFRLVQSKKSMDD